ncbi:MAG: type IV secretory system conjugative DNA transfer family protein [Synergistaceae bacterium]|nr:type IV secretory system conjugative DNA transfer family protein [Synergistaceae bacterium]
MNADKIILGEGAIFSSDSNITGLNNNVIVCGTSGCGKTVSIAEPRILETFNSSLIVTVTKRRLAQKYKSLFEERGYIVKDMNFADPSESNVTYDPLKYIKTFSDITFLAESVVRSNPRKEKNTTADPYWDEAAISLLSAEIAYVLGTKTKPTFSDVLELHDSIEYEECSGSIKTNLDGKFKMFGIKGHKLSNFAMSCWKSFQRLPLKTASCIFGTLNTTIDTLFSPELREMIKKNESVDFEALASKKTVLFIATSAVNPTLNCFINMFYAQAFKKLFEFAEAQPDGKLPIPVHLLADDFATGSPILLFPDYISIFREKMLSVTLLIQSESQLERMYGPDATTIINNADTYVYMGGMDLLTCRHISERANVPLEDVLTMPVGKMYIFRRGQKAIFTERYNVTESPLYQCVTQEYEDGILRKNKERHLMTDR